MFLHLFFRVKKDFIRKLGTCKQRAPGNRNGGPGRSGSGAPENYWVNRMEFTRVRGS